MVESKQFLFNWGVLLFIFWCGVSVPTGAFGQTVRFVFAPPAGTRAMDTVVVEKRKDFGPLGERVERGKSKVLLTIDKTDDGYRLVNEVLELEATGKGRQAPSAFQEALSKAKIVFRVDSSGKLRRIEGYESLMARLKEAVPQALLKSVGKVMNADVMKSRDRADWSGRIEAFAGETVKIGDTWSGVSSYRLPSREFVKYYFVTRFSGLEACGGRECVVIETYYDTDLDGLMSLLGEVMEDVSRVVPPPRIRGRLTRTSMKGRVRRLMEPETMLIHFEKLERVIEMTLEGPGGKFPATLSETRTYSFVYGQN